MGWAELILDDSVCVCPQPLGGSWCLSLHPQKEGGWQLGWGAAPGGHGLQLQGRKKLRPSMFLCPFPSETSNTGSDNVHSEDVRKSVKSSPVNKPKLRDGE